MTYPGLSMWNGSSKIHYFMDFWHSFCWRLWRPWMLLSTKSKGHKSKFRISWMYRSCFHGLKVHFWWPNKHLIWCKSSLNTLYLLSCCGQLFDLDINPSKKARSVSFYLDIMAQSGLDFSCNISPIFRLHNSTQCRWAPW